MYVCVCVLWPVIVQAAYCSNVVSRSYRATVCCGTTTKHLGGVTWCLLVPECYCRPGPDPSPTTTRFIFPLWERRNNEASWWWTSRRMELSGEKEPFYNIVHFTQSGGCSPCTVLGVWGYFLCLWSSGRVGVRVRVIQASLVSFALTPTSPALPHSNTCGLYQTRLVSYLTRGPTTECLSNDAYTDWFNVWGT